MQKSYFDGGLFGLLLHSLFAFLVTVLTLGICYPWGIVHLIKWKISHTVINGHRLVFEGTAVGLFGTWIKWLFLIIITIGIYSLWVNLDMKKWITKHTHFAD